MARNRDEDEQGRSGLVRVVDEDDDENGNGGNGGDDPFATGEARPGAVTTRRPNPGNGNGEDEDELRSKVAKLEGEVARLRVAAGLEGRREEVATVGDVLAANEAQAAALRAELAETIRQGYDEWCDEIAARVEERLLDTVAPEDEGNGGKGGKVGATRRGKRTGKKPGPRNVRELEGPYARDGERGLWYVDEDGNWYDEDGTPA